MPTRKELLTALQDLEAQVYSHRLYTFYEPSTGVAVPQCWYCRRYATEGYCAERHRQAPAKAEKAPSGA